MKSDDWVDWREAGADRTGTAAQLLAKHLSRFTKLNMLHATMLSRLASLIVKTAIGLEEDGYISLLVRIAIVPFAIAYGLDLKRLLKGCPIETSLTEDDVKQTAERLRKLGMDHL